MKKILVPTDFSFPAKNAAFYAMHLATTMQASVKLCNAIMVPVDVPMAAQISWPLVEFSTLEHEAIESLKKLAKGMEAIFENEVEADAFHPPIEYSTGVGSAPDVIAEFSDHNDISMVVMGMHGASGTTQFLLGSSARAMVQDAKIPVLLVPKEARFKGVHKIAFATDLSEKDIELIHKLADFARLFNAQILLVHVNDEGPEDKKENQKKIEAFLNEITNKVNYHKIYYEYVWNIDIDNGLEWLVEHGEVSMLAMVHRKHNIFHKIFKGSHTQRLKNRIKLPLLVLPELLKTRI